MMSFLFSVVMSDLSSVWVVGNQTLSVTAGARAGGVNVTCP